MSRVSVQICGSMLHQNEKICQLLGPAVCQAVRLQHAAICDANSGWKFIQAPRILRAQQSMRTSLDGHARRLLARSQKRKRGRENVRRAQQAVQTKHKVCQVLAIKRRCNAAAISKAAKLADTCPPETSTTLDAAMEEATTPPLA